MELAEREVLVSTQYGRMPAFVVHPQAKASPGIIFYMDAPGIREELRAMARRIAKQGYCCLLPDLYYRLGTIRLDTSRRDSHMSAVIAACRTGLKIKDVMSDTAGLIAFLDAEAGVQDGPLGCVGYCFSGQYVVAAAATFPHRMKAIASVYGTGVLTEDADSPHRRLRDVEGEMYFAFAENDKSIPAATVGQISEALKSAGVKHSMDVFPGTEHAYCFPERDAYNAVAAERTWCNMVALWDRNLKRG
jgi:carboxymethylenebutenolidase